LREMCLLDMEEITVSELLKGVIIGNANDASAVLAEKAGGSEENFAKLMNAKAAELKMENTVFTNCNGYYGDDKQISTAADLAKLCAELAKYDFLREYFTCWRDFVRGGETELVNANEIVKDYKGIAGFKAGYTENSGYCIAAGAERDGVMYISVVLGCTDKYDSFSEAKRLMSTGFSGYTVFVPELTEKDIPENVAVKGGMARQTAVECGRVKSVVLPNGAADSLSASVIIPEYLYAPVEKGDKIGEIHFIRGDETLFAVDITAAESVEKINIIKAMGIILKNLLTF
ncbi:MAG: D-alanyl-D-alanine carboxypeptidase, partial [Oscillospiraceae bacterium]|nr:D-alanyl-D-alanine carboxypeptidase [Oscillospiraceae bacterium]